jgi:hypothetical protein
VRSSADPSDGGEDTEREGAVEGEETVVDEKAVEDDETVENDEAIDFNPRAAAIATMAISAAPARRLRIRMRCGVARACVL